MNPDILASVAAVLGGHRGKGRAIHKDALAREVGIPERAIQRAVGELINDHDLDIGSHPTCGYWMIDTDNPDPGVARAELDLAERNLKPRALKILRRLSRLHKTTVAKICRQLALEFGEN